MPFVKNFEVDTSEFSEPVESFGSFNAFFTRTLKKGVRPLDPKAFVIPADGRYLFYEKASELSSFYFKGKSWSLEWLLQNKQLAEQFKDCSIVLGRLAPPDYHWFHFPCDGVPSEAKLIPGALFSVNPLALKKRPTILCENKRRITELETTFGKVLLLEIGATNVGSIHETFVPHAPVKKGDPKGYFSFGGSEVILLLPPSVLIDPLLIAKTKEGVEVRCLLGESLTVS